MTDLEAHFATSPPGSEIEDLLGQARIISQRYFSAASAQVVSSRPNLPGVHAFPNGSQWIPTSTEQTSPRGDHVLGNTMTCMLNSMLHYEFHHAIAGGDIGRAMNIMAVCVSFIVTGINLSSCAGLDFHFHRLRKRKILQRTA